MRTIARIDIKNQNVIKGINLEGLRKIGNPENIVKEYYLNGIEFTYDDWNEIMKGKEGLPWYKKPAPKGVTHRN